MEYVDGIPVWGDVDADSLRQAKTCRKDADYVAMMADHHLGYSAPIGAVVAYKEHVSPSAVGYDIACGNLAVMLDAHVEDVLDDISVIMDKVWDTFTFGVGGFNKEPVDDAVFDSPRWEAVPCFVRCMKDHARNQFGTIGSGNHYVDIFVDELNRVWVGVHFGSRGFGYQITQHYLKEFNAPNGIYARPVLVEVDNWLGRDYIESMRLAGEYAYAAREWVCKRIADIMGADIVDSVHNHHNFAWKEEHGGEEYWVVRKGATPAFPGQRGFVGGSMCEEALIVEGVDTHEAEKSFRSTVHGAGRLLSRRFAKQWLDKEVMNDWVRDSGVELRGAGIDESPDCYKRLSDVIAAHSECIKVLHKLRPVGVAMA